MNKIFKSVALTALLALMGGQPMVAQVEEAFNGATFEQVWKSDVVLEVMTAMAGRAMKCPHRPGAARASRMMMQETGLSGR